MTTRAAAAATVPPDNNALFAAAIQALTTVITTINAPPPPTYEPFAPTQPFNVATRAGSQAYTNASSPLDELWDGEISTFPSFLVSLRIHANDSNWNAVDPHGIMKIAGKNILTDYHTITTAKITSARQQYKFSRHSKHKDHVQLHQITS